MINRCVVILKYKDPAIRWINEADPYHEDPGITKEDVNEDRTVYLISDEVGESPEAVREWIKLNREVLFESELEGWYNSPELWPKKRTQKLFDDWFDVECHTVLEDTVEGPIFDDGI